MNFFEKYHERLYNCSKPYQYVGGEIFSANKDFDSAKVRFAMCFPDKYEIGISNLGARILYNQVNMQENYMADRAYAPEPDFVPEKLYCVESKRPICDFDIVGFSLQYELSYPTVLKMLDMSGISVRNKDRKENEPIVLAGGPCTFNPLPMSEFIDVFVIGDGEQAVVEMCQVLEKTKHLSRQEKINELCKLKGFWSASVGGTVQKRVEPLTYDTALKKHPIAFSSSIHDRAIVEIRRGCGRMCRFCQPGHVTLPVRERPAEEIIKITKELVHNTGYDEYSLLSLSSNDYSNIKEVIKELSCEFDKKKVGVSLPSQRIDHFSLELAELTQSVRKSTMTLAPEAGSQRLRNVIKKNISQEQIMDAVLTLYENGWSRIKFYFILGLPTETLEDMDEFAKLMESIRYRCRGLKQEKGLKHGLDVTCTLSIFVPKPFTPFQFCPQMDLDKVMEHVLYLKEKTKHIKGLKLNYHEPSISQIEAVLTRGDSSLCDFIEKLYQKGCYLDAWGEYFKQDVWDETAKECGIDIKALAKKEYSTNDELPWNFIDIGVRKEWFIEEYKNAFGQPEEFNFQPTCEQKCVNCGVCSDLRVHKILDKPFKARDYVKVEHKPVDPRTAPTIQTFKYRLKVTKLGILRYFSHLDWQNTFLKAILRSDLKIAFTQGFNPTPKVSMGVALPLFLESYQELVDIELLNHITCNEVKDILSKHLPCGCEIVDIRELKAGEKAIDHTAQWAEYKVSLIKKDDCNLKNFMLNCNQVLSSQEILLTKKNKKGLLKTSNIKSSIQSYRFEDNDLFIILKTGQGSDIPAVRADDIMKIISNDMIFDIKRIRFFDENLEEL
ncbi:DUF2344 domain-containing protein [bacterium]|nr:DUF2344 domain-containing protein [bacterium]